MKRRIYLLLALIALLVFSLPVFAKGGIEDGDAFDTYIGKTMKEVKEIAPYFKEMTSDAYEIDSNEIASLLVGFGEDGKVKFLMVIMNFSLSDFADDTDIQAKVVALGWSELGIITHEVLDCDVDTSGLTFIFEDDIYSLVTVHDGLTAITASYKNEFTNILIPEK